MYYIEFESSIHSLRSDKQFQLFKSRQEALEAAEYSARQVVELLKSKIGTTGKYHCDDSKILLSWGQQGMACWIVRHKTAPIYIESINVDGVRVSHEFISVEDMMRDWDSDDPSMGDNEILLVIRDGTVLYSSLGNKPKEYGGTLRTADMMEWFRSPTVPAENESKKREDENMLVGLDECPQIISTVRVNLIDTKTNETIEELYDEAAEYREDIAYTMARFTTEKYPYSDLMKYFELPQDKQMEKSIKYKIQTATPTVFSVRKTLYAALNLELSDDLTAEEYKAFIEWLQVQYRDGWGAALEMKDIQTTGTDAVRIRLYHEEMVFYTGEEFNSMSTDIKKAKTDSLKDKRLIKMLAGALEELFGEEGILTENEQLMLDHVCECDSGHEQVGTVCRYCYARNVYGQYRKLHEQQLSQANDDI